jgi:hypothetical protein
MTRALQAPGVAPPLCRRTSCRLPNREHKCVAPVAVAKTAGRGCAARGERRAVVAVVASASGLLKRELETSRRWAASSLGESIVLPAWSRRRADPEVEVLSLAGGPNSVFTSRCALRTSRSRGERSVGINGTCAVCGASLDSRRRHARFCSARCRREHYQLSRLLSATSDGNYLTLAQYEMRRRSVHNGSLTLHQGSRAHEPPQHRLPALGLMSERRHGDRRLKQPSERRLARLKRPTPQPPHRRSLAVVRLEVHDEQRYLERRREVYGGELSRTRLDEREVSARERLLKPAVVAPLDRYERMFACPNGARSECVSC